MLRLRIRINWTKEWNMTLHPQYLLFRTHVFKNVKFGPRLSYWLLWYMDENNSAAMVFTAFSHSQNGCTAGAEVDRWHCGSGACKGCSAVISCARACFAHWECWATTCIRCGDPQAIQGAHSMNNLAIRSWAGSKHCYSSWVGISVQTVFAEWGYTSLVYVWASIIDK